MHRTWLEIHHGVLKILANCIGSAEQIAYEARATEATVQKHLNTLEAVGCVQKGRRSLYQLTDAGARIAECPYLSRPQLRIVRAIAAIGQEKLCFIEHIRQQDPKIGSSFWGYAKSLRELGCITSQTIPIYDPKHPLRRNRVLHSLTTRGREAVEAYAILPL